MQDRYAGDVGDFLTYALLRWLIEGSGLRLGVVWYLVPDETHNGDGRHISYLDEHNPIGRRLRALDPDLHDRLGDVVRTGRRSVRAIESSGALPAGTTTFATHVDTRSTQHRAAWARRAVGAMEDRDVVFVDPDNGLRAADHPVPRHRATAGKHAYLDELSPYLERGQSLIVCHHADRTAPVDLQARRRLADLHRGCGIEPLAAVRASRGSTRLFLVVAAAQHRSRLAGRLDALRTSPWSGELRVLARSGLDASGVPTRQ